MPGEFLSRSLNIARAQTSLASLIGELPARVEEFAPTIPSEVEVSEAIIQQVMQRVSVLSSETTIEQSGPIGQTNSIHHFWNFVINQLQPNRPGSELTRVVYQWAIPNPLSTDPKTAKAIDFTFVPVALAHLNWMDYGGGLEAKINPTKSDQVLSSGLMATAGFRQALARCAMCIACRWKKNGWRGDHRAYCCYADACTFGVARVRLDNNIITAERYGPIPLPGHTGSRDPTALRFLAYILSTPQEGLQELLSISPSQDPDQLQGYVNNEQVIWTLGAFLGRGGFGTVYAASGTSDQVIKISDSSSLHAEASKLQRLSKCTHLVGHAFPRLVSVLSTQPTGPDSTSTELALRLSPRGVPLPHYIAACDHDRSLLTQLSRLVGSHLVSTLREVHEANIAHSDIRGDNVLLLPHPEDLDRVIDAAGVFTLVRDAIRDIDLTLCHVLLSDWGSAKYLETSNHLTLPLPLPQRDLRMVIDMIHHQLGGEGEGKDSPLINCLN